MKFSPKKLLIHFLILCILFSAFVPAISAAAATEAANDENYTYSHVVVIGVDGAGAFFEDAETPNMDSIFANGAITYSGLTENPSISAQSWGSLMHGVTNDVHKLTNSTTGAYPNDSEFPSFFRVIRENDANATLASFTTWETINNIIIEDNLGINKVGYSGTDADLTTRICDYVASAAPTALFVQYDNVDAAGHSYGYGNAGHLAKITETDALIGRVYQAYADKGIIDDTLFIVTTDHGGTGTSHGGYSDTEKYITFAAAGKTVQKNGTIVDFEIRDTAAIVLYALGYEQPESWTARVPSGLFEGVVAGERPTYVGEITDRYHQTVPTPDENGGGYISDFVDNDILHYLPLDNNYDDKLGAETSKSGNLYFTDAYYGQGVALDDGYITLEGFAPGTDSFTVTMWVKSTGTSGDPLLFANKSWASGKNPGILACMHSYGYIHVNFANGTDRVDLKVNLPEDFKDGWMHVAIKFDRELGELGLAYDFGEYTTIAIPDSLKDTVAEALYPLVIGQDGTGAYQSRLNATIDDFVIFDGVLDSKDLTALKSYYGKDEEINFREFSGYPALDTVRSDLSSYVSKELSVYLPFENSAIDFAGNVATSTIGTTEYVDGVFGKAFYPKNGYTTISNWTPGAESFSVTAWVKNGVSGGDPLLFSNKDWSSGNNPGVSICLHSNGTLIINFADGTGKTGRIDLTTKLPTDSKSGWMHVTIIFDRDNSTIGVAYDFGEVTTVAIPETLKDAVAEALYPFNIGQDGKGSYQSRLNAYVDEFMIFDGALGKADIAGLKNYFLANASVESTPEVNFRDHESVSTPEKNSSDYISNYIDNELQLYLPFDSTADDATGNYATSTNKTVTYKDGYFGQAADISSGYVTVKDWQPGKDSFTIALWVNYSGMNGSDPLVFANKDWNSGSNPGIALCLHANGTMIVNLADGTGQSGRIDLKPQRPADAQNGWMHLTITYDREASVMGISFDFNTFNIVSIPATLSGVAADGLYPLNIGQDGKGSYMCQLKALIDELMIFEGALDSNDLAALRQYYSKQPDTLNVIKGAAVNLGESISLVYTAALDDAHKDAVMRFYMNGMMFTVNGTLSANNIYTYEFKNIAPQCMGDKITAELVYDGKVIDVIDGYSVKSYCVHTLYAIDTKSIAGYTDEKYSALKVLIEDMLNYGAAAQAYQNYKTDALVNSSVSGSVYTPLDDSSAKAVTESTVDGIEFTAAGVRFDYVNSIYVRFVTAGSNVMIRVTDESGAVTEYTLYDCVTVSADGTCALYIPVLPTDFDERMTIELCTQVNGEWITCQTLEYSVAAYVYYMQNQNSDGELTAMARLARALYNYGKSTSNYVKIGG